MKKIVHIGAEGFVNTLSFFLPHYSDRDVS